MNRQPPSDTAAVVAEAAKPFSPHEAAAMIVDDYGGRHEPGSHRLDIDGCQLYFHSGTLVVRGSDDKRDWWRNLLVWPWTLVGDSGIRWVHGSLVDARVVYAWCKAFGPEKIKLIIAHSRGGPIAQIVGYSLGIPVWTFASPRALYWGDPVLKAPITNHMIDDDPIRFFYPFARFVGGKERHRANGGPLTLAGLASNHAAAAYLKALTP